MNSAHGLSGSQIGQWGDVGGFGRDPEMGDGRLPPGSPPVFRPATGDTPGNPTAPYGGFLDWLTGRKEEMLGAFRLTGAPATSDIRGYPPTAGPPTSVQHFVPPAWAVSVSPDEEARYDSPSQGRY